MNTHRNVVFATSVYERWIGLTRDGHDPRAGAAVSRHRPHRPRDAGDADGQPAGAVLPVRRRRGVPARRSCIARRSRCRRSRPSSRCSTATRWRKHDLSSLTKVYTGGAPTPPGVLDDWHGRTGARIQPMYGLTEATSPTHMTPHGAMPPVDPHTGAMSVGVPVFNTDVQVVTDAGHEAGAARNRRARDRRAADHPRLLAEAEGDGAVAGGGELRTGDVGFMDEQGWFYLVDRAKDMIVASGFKVWPREVEEVLYLHPAVREAAVVGIPDPYRGETIKAVISLKAGQHGDRRRDQGVRARAHGGLQVPARRRDHRRAAEDDERQDHAPAAAADHARRGRRCRCRAELVDVSYPQLRAAVEARAVLEVGRRLAAPEPRHDCRSRRRQRSTSGCGSMLAQLDDGAHVRRPRRVPRGQRGLSRGRHRSRRERAPVARASAGCGCASCSPRR